MISAAAAGRLRCIWPWVRACQFMMMITMIMSEHESDSESVGRRGCVQAPPFFFFLFFLLPVRRTSIRCETLKD